MRIKIILFTSIILLLSVANLTAQNKMATLSGAVKDKSSRSPLSFVNVILKSAEGNKQITATITNEEGRYSFSDIHSGNYNLEFSFVGYKTILHPVYVGSLSEFLDQGTIEMETESQILEEVTVVSKQNSVSGKMDKKTFSLADNISQNGGSALQAMQNLPGVTVQDGKVQLRGNDKVTVLIDGKQTAMTGFGNQSGLDNIPASAIEKIEIINNPSAKFDANGNAGIINIVYKKNKKEGFNGKVGLTSGLGSLWQRKENLPTIRPQYTLTPKVNPTVSLNYRKNKVNLFFQGDYLYTETLNKNEYVNRNYDDGTIINQQLKRNRDTHFTTIKSGVDWIFNDQNTLTVSGLFGSEKIIDHGDQPFFNADYSERLRLWQFLEDELKTTVMGTVSYQHKFKEAGRLLNVGFNYTFHRENEKYFFDNILPSSSSKDSFKLLSDESVVDLNIDYIRPLKKGRIETGFKFRNRNIPTNMKFFPGNNSPIDADAGGKATYEEIIPAVYSNYIYETNKIEAEIGLRLEYLDLEYEVNPDHPTYKTDGYSYFEPFPNFRLAYKLNENNKISLFYNRRIDRPNEVDIRIFPKYDDAEIIKVGNPGLRPQFTNSIELGFKRNLKKGYVYSALYHRFANATITRIASTVPDSNLIYAIFQNAGRSYNTGTEIIVSQDIAKWYSSNLNLNAYYNQINAFTVQNLYPEPNTFSAGTQRIFSGNVKWNNKLHLSKKTDAQLSFVYLAPDVIPQGKIKSRFSVDLGIKKSVQEGKGEFFINASDLFNTFVIRKKIQGKEFSYTSNDYYETQVVRLGYNYKF
ncbi:TonB-dependent receptor [Flavobacterium amniphilum]|uniref:outer membrane beta-barrel protein n=1 Tax=Flavobacterium amniphilum TaxID=1834035 RepID=UPI002029B65A|nr:outer membrane beta-barrel protein [Flavobacterium amniphilum]MCL9805639.1 TonB-dependent receptor [Flavobacterium amniphilum]